MVGVEELVEDYYPHATKTVQCPKSNVQSPLDQITLDLSAFRWLLILAAPQCGPLQILDESRDQLTDCLGLFRDGLKLQLCNVELIHSHD
ncbi:MAG: hypothetical protein QOJ64_1920 [Acidobacteriota bacterium]|nr:hypothetical protein [Acidobacteriota bacterium]